MCNGFVYSLINCVPISTNRFTQKCDCFQNHSDFFCEAYYEVGKNKYQNVNSRPNNEPFPLKKFLPCAYVSIYKPLFWNFWNKISEHMYLRATLKEDAFEGYMWSHCFLSVKMKTLLEMCCFSTNCSQYHVMKTWPEWTTAYW